VLVGDRGMLTQPQIDKLKQHPGWGWITALKSVAIGGWVDSGSLRRSFLDEKNLAEITSPDYPGERLMACYHPLLAEERGRKRQALLEATEKGLTKIRQEVGRRKKKILKEKEIALKVGKVLGHYKLGKHFECTLGEGSFQFQRREEAIQEEAPLDGIDVIRTSESKERLSPEATVRSYKSLSEVERAFRCLKGMELRVRPIRHRTEERCRRIFFSACWPTMWNGTCVEPGRRSYSRMRSAGRNENDGIPSGRRSPRNRPRRRRAPIQPGRDFRCTA